MSHRCPIFLYLVYTNVSPRDFLDYLGLFYLAGLDILTKGVKMFIG